MNMGIDEPGQHITFLHIPFFDSPVGAHPQDYAVLHRQRTFQNAAGKNIQNPDIVQDQICRFLSRRRRHPVPCLFYPPVPHISAPFMEAYAQIDSFVNFIYIFVLF
jgi:hypothetical protein